MAKAKNLVGKKFGRLTVIERAENDKYKNACWLCQCECGNKKIIKGVNLVRGFTKSCGCLHKEKFRHVTHNLTNTRIFTIWMGIKKRCCNKKSSNYNLYGGRGITYCKEWEQFESFYNWAINNGYKDNLSIDRIDVNGNYEPNNCRWVDMKTQQNNTRRNHYITYKNETKTATEWAEFLGVGYWGFIHRINRGWNIDRIFNQPYRKS